MKKKLYFNNTDIQNKDSLLHLREKNDGIK